MAAENYKKKLPRKAGLYKQILPFADSVSINSRSYMFVTTGKNRNGATVRKFADNSSLAAAEQSTAPASQRERECTSYQKSAISMTSSLNR